ncbi:putative cell division control protein [Zalerion maritima]|uniref:Cell division control protein n=1 Tax=Zalerion maritima TaxID=339359 RepID=A0AAD5WW98_9PEZI|nr:putative cell division control protein [Zalerion maritima]
MPVTALGKRTRNGGDELIAAASPSAKRTKSDCQIFNDENQDPNMVTVPKTPSKQTKTWVLSSARKPLTPRTPRFRESSDPAPGTPTRDALLLKSARLLTNPKTPTTPGSIQTVYHLGRQLFTRSIEPTCLIGRENERDHITRFLQRCEKHRPGGCLYVSGPPGTGKSAMVRKVTEQAIGGSKSVRQAYVNCMSVKSSRELYSVLLDLLLAGQGTTLPEEGTDPLATLKEMFTKRKKSTDIFLVVLDEVDHLLTMDPESLHVLFELALQKTSRLALIGIANALDLTDRFLPRLKSRNLKPELLPFLPYSAPQIKDIVSSRLRSLLPQDSANSDFIPFMHPAAIELCSRKVASHSGDLRRAFEICRRAIDLTEAQTKEKHENEAREKLMLGSPSHSVLGEKKNLSSSRKTCSYSSANVLLTLSKSLQSLTVESAPRVSISHLNKVTAAAFSNGVGHRLKTLNLQQKAALCSLVALEKRVRSMSVSFDSGKPRLAGGAPTIKELYNAYCKLCTQDEVLHPLSTSEFREVMGSLEALSLVGLVGGKAGSFGASPAAAKRPGRRAGANAGQADDKRVASSVNQNEMEKSLDGAGSSILRRILGGDLALD